MRWPVVLFALLLSLWPFSSGRAVLSPGHPALTRLWGLGPEGERVFTCTAFYIRTPKRAPEGLGTLATAGHCAEVSRFAGRDADQASFAYVNWRALVDGRIGVHRRWDVAIGTAPELPESGRPLWLGDPPRPDQRVWVIGYPAGVERVVACEVVGPSRPAGDGTPFPGSWDLDCPPDSILPGSSGSPVVDSGGRVVGVLWGRSLAGDRVLITPVTALRELLRLLEA
ncbi:MAG: serine protease [Armatimonadota bacterium]|nr:serine protease [Armatimonadota bacterium]